MSITENNTIILAEVAELKQVASSDTNLLVEDGGIIKRYNLNEYIMKEFVSLENTIDNLDARLEDANNNIALIDDVVNDEDSGLIKIVNDLTEELDTQKNKKCLIGHRMQFMDGSDDFTLLTKNAQQEFSLPIDDLNIKDCIKNGSGYGVYLYLDISYQMKETAENYISGILHTTATINLNTAENSKKVIFTLPLTDTSIVMLMTVNNNKIKMTVENFKGTTMLNTDFPPTIEYGEFEIKQIQVIENNNTNNNNNNNNAPEEIIEIPLTLCFDPRDILTYGSSSDTIPSTEMMYGSKIKFDATDMTKGATLDVTYRNNVTTHEKEELKYLSDNLSHKGNIVTIKDASDILPLPQIAYYDSAYTSFGINTPASWFKYWTEGSDIVGYVSQIHFNNYNYNGGIGHQIIFKKNTNYIVIDGQEYCRADTFCFPMEQWQAFVDQHEKYKFNIECVLSADDEIKEIKYNEIDLLDQKVKLFFEKADIEEPEDKPAMIAINYLDGIGNDNRGIRTGVYLRKGIKECVIKPIPITEQ